MASAVITLGVTINFSVKKIQYYKEKKRALKDEVFLSKDITEKMAANGDSNANHHYDHDLQKNAEDHSPSQYGHTENTESRPKRNNFKFFKSSQVFRSL
jgi:hypothetical protein